MKNRMDRSMPTHSFFFVWNEPAACLLRAIPTWLNGFALFLGFNLCSSRRRIGRLAGKELLSLMVTDLGHPNLGNSSMESRLLGHKGNEDLFCSSIEHSLRSLASRVPTNAFGFAWFEPSPSSHCLRPSVVWGPRPYSLKLTTYTEFPEVKQGSSVYSRW